MGADQLTGIPGVLSRMDALLAAMPSDLTTQRTFLSTYRRTTIAVGKRVEEGRFEDPAWVDRWDVAFADLYVSALEAHLAGGPVSRPWRQAFAAPAELPVLRLLLLGINAHINYDLPQALLAVISPEDFAKPALCSTIGVSISPGRIAFTRTFRAAYSTAVVRVRWLIAAFEA